MEIEEMTYLEAGKSITGAEESQMFGKPCFKTQGKAFICFFSDSMVFKLNGEAHASAIALHGSQLFDPSGRSRPMKEWVQVPFNHNARWSEFAKAAFEFVSTTVKK